MSSSFITPVLTLDESRLSNYDPQDPTDLSLLHSAFSKSSHLVDQGERLRNFSWRLWNRERLYCARNQPPSTRRTAPTPQNTPASSVNSEVPQLSSSIESSSTTETEEVTADDAKNAPTDSVTIVDSELLPTEQFPKERHITPLDLRNMVHSIKQPREFPRPVPRASESSRPTSTPANLAPSSSPHHDATESSTSTVATATTDSFASTGGKSGSSASSSNTGSSHSIVHGFTLGPLGMTSYTSKSEMGPPPKPILSKQCSNAADPDKQKSNNMFMLGSSSGSGVSIDERSLRDSVISRSLRSSGASQKLDGKPKDKTSFKDEVAVMKPKAHEDAAVFDDSEDEIEEPTDISESAIEEDDDAWEDAGSEEPEAKKEEEIKFYRVDSAAHLPSRRSALTLSLENQRKGSGLRGTPAYMRSRTSTPSGPSMPGSPESDSPLDMRGLQISAAKPIIPTTTNVQTFAQATSPRTTRRTMLGVELSESLKMNMLNERRQRNPLQTNSNQIRRAQTASDVPRLGQLPENREVPLSNRNLSTPQRPRPIPNWDQFFKQPYSDFHASGW